MDFLVNFKEATECPSRKEIKLCLQLIFDSSRSIKHVNEKKQDQRVFREMIWDDIFMTLGWG